MSTASSRNHPERLLTLERLLTEPIPAGVEPAPVLLDPLLGHVVGSVRRPGRVVHEERLVGHERLLLAHPTDRLVGHVLGEVVALVRRLGGIDRNRALVERREVLIGLAADEAVEVLEAAATRRPRVERPERAGLPDRHLVALAELGRRVPVELECHRQRCLVLGKHRRVPGSRGRHLGDAAHVHRMVVAAGQQRLTCRRAQRRGVEPIEFHASVRQPFRRRRVHRPTEGAARPEPAIVDQDDQHIGSAFRRPDIPDRRELGRRILRVVRGQTHVLDLGNGQDRPLNLCAHGRRALPHRHARQTLCPTMAHSLSRRSRIAVDAVLGVQPLAAGVLTLCPSK